MHWVLKTHWELQVVLMMILTHREKFVFWSCKIDMVVWLPTSWICCSDKPSRSSRSSIRLNESLTLLDHLSQYSLSWRFKFCFSCFDLRHVTTSSYTWVLLFWISSWKCMPLFIPFPCCLILEILQYLQVYVILIFIFLGPRSFWPTYKNFHSNLRKKKKISSLGRKLLSCDMVVIFPNVILQCIFLKNV